MKNQLSTKNSNAGNGQKALGCTGILVEMLWVQFQTISMKLYHNKVREFPGSSVSKESACSAEDPGSVPSLGRYPGEGNGNPLQYSCLEIPWTEEPGGLQSTGLQESDCASKPPPP